MIKKCNKCNIEKELDCFNKSKRHKLGVNSTCKICVNNKIREQYKINPDKYKARISKWKKENPIKGKEYVVKYQLANPDKVKKHNKLYRENNPDKIKECNKIWVENNPEYQDIYYLKNKEKILKQNNRYQKERKQYDPLYKLSRNLRIIISKQFKNNGYTKTSRTHEILGCSYEFFINNIKAQWLLPQNLDENGQVWMNWTNYGKYKKNIQYYGWDIDHIVPLSSAENEEELLKLCVYTNLQPLCSYVNRQIKKDNTKWVK